MKHVGKITALLIGMAIVIPFGLTASKPYVWYDYATLFGSISSGWQIGFKQDSNGAPPIDSVSFKRMRMESGVVLATKTYPKSTWGKPDANGYYWLTDSVLNYYGHYIYEVQACAGTNCGPWTLSTDPAHAAVNGVNRAWWIYAQAPDPTSPGVPSVTVFQKRS